MAKEGHEISSALNVIELDAVAQFGANLRETMVDILESVDTSWINWILAHPSRQLVVALTGGGAELPMVKELVEGSTRVNRQNIPPLVACSNGMTLSSI